MLRALRLEAHELCTLSNVPRQRDRAREERTEREEGEEDSRRTAATDTVCPREHKEERKASHTHTNSNKSTRRPKSSFLRHLKYWITTI